MLSQSHYDLEKIYAALREGVPEERLIRNASMVKYTTFRVGGPADIFVQPSSCEEIRFILERCKGAGVPCFVMGQGSNLLVRDGGLRGVVVRLGEAFSAITVQGNVLEAEAGATLPALARKAAENGLSGLEFACGIPGTIGGALFMNAGAYGGEMADTFLDALVLDAEQNLRTVTGEEMAFGYRKSALGDRGWVAVSARFHLQVGKKEDILAQMKALNARRNEKQPMEKPSAGSTFKRPPDAFAAQLIEECGLKGYALGGAMVSEKHSGFIVNIGSATAAEILALMAHVQEVVQAKKGIRLEPELRVVGEA